MNSSKIKLNVLLSLSLFIAGVHTAQAVVLNIADQNDELKTLFSVSDINDKASSQYHFANFVGGPAILESFRANALDAGIVGNTPPIQAHVAKADLLIVAGKTSQEPSYRFALKKGLKIDNLSELKGKKIAFAQGTARQPFVLEALALGGLKPSDVTLVPLRASDFPAAVQFGQVDVAPLTVQQFGRFVSGQPEAEHAFQEKLYASLPKNVNYIYASKKSLSDPEKNKLIAQLVQDWVKGEHWIKTNPQVWTDAYYVKSQGLSKDIAEASYKDRGVITFPPLKSFVPDQQKTADLLTASGEIPSKLDVNDEFYFQFNDLAANADKQNAIGDGHE